jgi:hypothetical protein
MRQLRGNPRRGRRVAGTLKANLTVDEAVAIRADEATWAKHCARRAEQARAVAHYGAMNYWTREYRRATQQCHSLGERIRRVGASVAAAQRQPDRPVAHLPARPATRIFSPDEAA